MDWKHRVYRLILALAFSVTRGPEVVETILKLLPIHFRRFEVHDVAMPWNYAHR